MVNEIYKHLILVKYINDNTSNIDRTLIMMRLKLDTPKLLIDERNTCKYVRYV